MALNTLEIFLKANTGQFSKAMGAQQSTIQKFSSMAKAAAVPIAALGVASLKAFGDFDKAMTQSTAIMAGMTDSMRGRMESTARAMAKETSTSAKDLAQSYYYLASAGFSAEQSIGALGAVEKFSVAGAFDMATATDLLTDAQSALGLTSKDAKKNLTGMTKVSDALVKANTLANASVQQFSESLTNEAGAAIKQYNIDLEEGIAILATYADQGLKGAASGSAMARMARLLVKGINENESAFQKMNINYKEFATTGKNITQVLDGITKATWGMGPAQKTATLQMLGFEVKAQQAILPLLGMTEKIGDYQKALMEAGGITEDVANKQLESFNSQMSIAKNRVMDMALSVGETLAPAVTGLIDLLGKANVEVGQFNTGIGGYFEKIGQAYQMEGVGGALSASVGGMGTTQDVNQKFENFLKQQEGSSAESALTQAVGKADKAAEVAAIDMAEAEKKASDMAAAQAKTDMEKGAGDFISSIIQAMTDAGKKDITTEMSIDESSAIPEDAFMEPERRGPGQAGVTSASGLMGVALQGAIGGKVDEQQKMVSLQQRMLAALDVIARNSQGGYAYV